MDKGIPATPATAPPMNTAPELSVVAVAVVAAAAAGTR
jgi:hypothetical protein